MKKLGKRLQRVVDLTRGGQALSRLPDGRYCFEPSGIPCGQKTVQQAIEQGLLKPNNDGLFADSHQTWGAS